MVDFEDIAYGVRDGIIEAVEHFQKRDKAHDLAILEARAEGYAACVNAHLDRGREWIANPYTEPLAALRAASGDSEGSG